MSPLEIKRWPVRVAWIVILFCAVSFYFGRLSVRTIPVSSAPAAPPSSPAGLLDFPPATAPEENHPVVATVKIAAAKTWDESLWRELWSQPATPARNAALAALLEILGATDPQRALELARSEKNLLFSETLLHAALRGWGSTATEQAALWALALPDETARSAAMTAVFAGAIVKPEEAVGVAKKIFADNPGEATGYGNSLIDALCDAANFSMAIQLAAAGEGEAQRSIWTAEAYARWAALQPEQAAQAAIAVADPVARIEALHGIVGGWAQADPAGLTHFVAGLPAGADRASMMGQSLQSWIRLDPEAAADWINHRETSPDYDEGVAAVASVNFVKPGLALGWAESIANVRLRSETVATVLHNWALEDLPAAKQYFTATRDLSPEDRQRISDIIATAEDIAH